MNSYVESLDSLTRTYFDKTAFNKQSQSAAWKWHFYLMWTKRWVLWYESFTCIIGVDKICDVNEVQQYYLLYHERSHNEAVLMRSAWESPITMYPIKFYTIRCRKCCLVPFIISQWYDVHQYFDVQEVAVVNTIWSGHRRLKCFSAASGSRCCFNIINDRLTIRMSRRTVQDSRYGI